MKKIFLAFLIISSILGGYLIARNFIPGPKITPPDISKTFEKTITSTIEKQVNNLSRDIKKIEKAIPKTVSSPKTLVRTTPSVASPVTALSKIGVLAWTNVARTMNGNLPLLNSNQLLDQIAALRLKDMFQYQYFEHISPVTGIGASDLAKENGYEYILIGENIALGNFENDQKLVDAWMNSPGHRANILNARYLELGVSVGEGTFNGQKTWLAVQIFGRPLSACQEVDLNLKSAIETNEVSINNLQARAQTIRAELEAGNPITEVQVYAYNQKVAVHNELIAQVNDLVSKTKDLISTYNNQVQIFNTCLAS